MDVEEETGGAESGTACGRGPSWEERAEHALSHCPHRSWCSVCTRGRFPEKPCRDLSKGGRSNARELHVDFAHPAAAGGIGITILTAREKQSGAVFAAVVDDKGESIRRAAARLVRFWGRHRLRALGNDGTFGSGAVCLFGRE